MANLHDELAAILAGQSPRPRIELDPRIPVPGRAPVRGPVATSLTELAPVKRGLSEQEKMDRFLTELPSNIMTPAQVASTYQKNRQSAPANPPMGDKSLPSDDRSRNLALLAGGLSAMASRNPNFLGALGEAGLAGLQTYTGAEASRAASALESRKTDISEMNAKNVGRQVDAQIRANEIAAETAKNPKYNRVDTDKEGNVYAIDEKTGKAVYVAVGGVQVKEIPVDPYMKLAISAALSDPLGRLQAQNDPDKFEAMIRSLYTVAKSIMNQ